MKRNSLIAIVLNWNELDYTKRCLSSLLSQNIKNIDILLIDNHSHQDPTNILLNKYPNLIVIRTTRNLGVAGGRNIGVRYALDNNYEYLLFFDNDAYADTKMIDSLLNAAQKYPDTAIFGPKILYMNNNKQIIWRAGCTSWKWTYLHSGYEIITRFCRLLNKKTPAWADTIRGEGQADNGQFDKEKDISFQIGCAQLIRTKIFKQIGLLDTEFSPYGSEDIDFCERTLKAGWKIKYIPDAVCWHRATGSFTNNYNRSFYNTKNILLLARKNLTPLYFSLVFLPDFIFLTFPLMIAQGLMRKQFEKVRGYIDGITWNFKDIRNRGILL